ncbi:hypothetical protein Sjap_023881 [Stephania japonica]|uniref:Uncharacterized protein n=1 Tax=Stephania japonica TaxID=461633 RepID=A0AAP0HKY5_9MAGN
MAGSHSLELEIAPSLDQIAERHVACEWRAVARLLAKIWEFMWLCISRKIDQLERGDGRVDDVADVRWLRRCCFGDVSRSYWGLMLCDAVRQITDRHVASWMNHTMTRGTAVYIYPTVDVNFETNSPGIQLMQVNTLF